ncbi:MAG TPA: UPF0175 family protein [Pyrinomonadaceae bacterium]|nr:UPF0175 family protein [Pyrinomonadaceae bacterium]
MNVAIELPKEIAKSLAGPGEDFSRIALEALAAQGYRDGKLSHSEVPRLLGFNSRWETDAFLKQAGAHLYYTEADLERDIEISQQIK